MQETRVWSLGGEEPLKKGMANQSSVLAWKVPWTEEPGKLQSNGVAKSQTHEQVTHKQMNYSYTQLLQTEYFCTSPKSLVEMLSSPLPLDGIIMWCLWKVVRIRWSHEGGTLINEISALIGVTKEFASPSLFSAMRGYKEKSAVCRPEEGPHQNTPMLSFCSQTSSLPNCEKWISVRQKIL